MMHRMRRVLILLAFCLFSGRTVGEPVVIDQSGQGLAFSHRGNCYAMLPEHVLGPPGRIRRLFSAQTAVPRVTGGGKVVYEPGNDLVLGYLTGEIETRCEPRWRDLPADVSHLLRENALGELVWVADSGLLERTPLRIDALEFDYLYAAPRDASEQGAGFQGQSGAILFIGDVPVGMALESGAGAEMIFLRMDAIVSRIERFLGGTVVRRPSPKTTEEGQRFRLTAWSTQIEGSTLDSLTGTGKAESRYRASLEDGPVIIEIAFPGDEAAVIERIELIGGDPGSGAVPKAIRVEVDSSKGQERRWRFFGAGDMSPAGDFKAFRGGGTWARRMRIRIDSAWRGEESVSLGRISVE